jgi:hypothetical protein
MIISTIPKPSTYFREASIFSESSLKLPFPISYIPITSFPVGEVQIAIGREGGI